MIDQQSIDAAYNDLAQLRESYYMERKELEQSIENLQNRVETINVHQEAISMALDRYDQSRMTTAVEPEPALSDYMPDPQPFGGRARA